MTNEEIRDYLSGLDYYIMRLIKEDGKSDFFKGFWVGMLIHGINELSEKLNADEEEE